MKLKKECGVSMITLIITIIVIIILTTIAMKTTSDTPDQANMTKYKQEIKNVQTAIEVRKVKNAANGTSEEKMNVGFKKVKLKNAPENFVSFDEYYEDTTGYIVDLEEINYLDSNFGQAYEKYESEEYLTFGDKDCDVFVYDADFKVYYIKGIKYDGSMNYTLD